MHTAQLTGGPQPAADPDSLTRYLPPGHRGRDLSWTSRTENGHALADRIWRPPRELRRPHPDRAVERHRLAHPLYTGTLDDGPAVNDANSEASGAMILHDPRAGAANVALPGLPWGRPITMPTVPGTLVLVPGWLA